MTAVDWHYPRPEFTPSVFVTLTRGPSPALSLFGPRRIGKTQFLVRDLGHHAVERYGHTILYASFWQSTAAPLATLIHACDEALRAEGYPSRLGRWLGRAMPSKIKLTAPVGGGLELDMGRAQEPEAKTEDTLILLDRYLGELANTNKPAILLLDEFQEVATAPTGDAVIAALRTSLDRRRDGLKTVFTGSSQVKLNKVFSTRSAPFFRFAAPIELPRLDDGFVPHQLACFHALYRRKIDPASAAVTFETFGRNPLFFQRWLTSLGLNPELDPDKAAEATAEALVLDLGLDAIWRGLKPSHRALTRMIAENHWELTGLSGAARMEALTGQPAPIPQTRQSYIRTLIRNGIVDGWDDGPRLSDPVFERWVLEKPESEF